MAGMFDDLVPGGSKPKAEKGGDGSGPWEDFNGPWTAYQGGAFDDLIPKPQEKSGLMRRAVGDTAVSAVKGAVGLVEAGIGLADIPTFGKAGQAAEAIGIRTKDAKAALDDLYSPEQKAANKAVSEAEGFIGTAKTALQNPSTIGHAVIESAPLLLPGAAIARGIGAAGRLAPAVAGGIGEGVVGAGMAAEQMRQNSEDGTLSGRQMGAALASGAGTAAFGIAGGKLAQSAIGKKLGMADVDTALAMSPAQRSVAGGVDSGLVKRIAGGAVSEGVLEELPQSMWEQAAQNYGEGKPLGEGVAEAGAMGMLAGGVMGGGFNALQGRQKKDDKPATGTEESPTLALPAPTYAGTPDDQTLAADVERANQVAAAQANADQVYVERAAFEQQREPEKLPVTGPLSAAVNVGIDAGATSITSPANPRFDVPAEPRGSFAQQAELARLIEEERADADDRRELAQLVSQERRDQSRRIAEASERRQALEDALADADQRVAGAAAQESEAARLRLLDSVLVDAGESGNPARQFGNALRRAGYRNTDFTEREQQTIQRFSDARAALNSPEATTVPAAPNELDPEAVGIRERTGGQQNIGAVLRDKPAEVVDLLSQGWKPVGKTLISPKGKRRNLNAEEFAAVREARGKKNNQQAEAALVGAQQQAMEAGNGLQEGGLEEKVDPANQLQAEAAMPDSANQTVINSALAPDPGQVTDGADSRAEFKKAQVDLGTALRDFAPAARMVPENTPELMPTLTRLFKASVGEVGTNPKDLIAHVKKQLKAEQETKAIWNKVGNNIYQKAALQAVADVAAQDTVKKEQQSRVAPIMKRDDLVGAIMRTTGGRGISPEMALTLTGDTANRQPRLRGLFKNGGTSDLSDLAELLRVEQGYDVRDGTHLEELIREQAAGNQVYSMERNERDAADNAERQYRDEINKRAVELGLKQARGKRTLETVEADIVREEQRLSDIEAQAEREAIIAADAVDDAIALDMTEADFMLWLSDDIAGTYTEEEIQRAQQDQTDRENARTEARSIADTEERAQGDSRQRDGNQPAAPEGRGTKGGARRDDEGFNLTQQTNEQAAEQFAQQQAGEDSEPTKAQADRERDAVPFSLGMESQPKPQGVQAGLFAADGRASVAATAESKTEAASAAVNRAESVAPEAAEDILAITPTDKARAHGQEKRIADFGEKIGGARKDMAVPIGPRTKVEKEIDERPAWMRKIRVMQITAMPGRINQQNVGKWQIMEETGGMRGAVRALTSSRFDTEAEAMSAVPHAVVSKRHRVYSYKDRQGNVLFGVFRNITDRKRGLVRGGFVSHAEAMEYLAQNPVAVIEHKFGYPERPWLDRIERIGANRLDGDVSTAMFQETFGFRAGEFGNWNMGGDGQAALNHAYEALLDLADAIGVPPKAISLNGQLAIAFGARGRGGKGSAAAHYEPDTMVINLTKIKGAGSLAHEWWHAVDDYFAKSSGRQQSSSVVANGYIQGGGQARPELIEAIKDVVDKMMYAETSRTTDADMIRDRARKRIDEARNTIDYHNRDLRSMMTEGRYNRGNKTATVDQLAKWDAFIERLKAGDMGEMVYIENPSKMRGAMGFQTGTVLRDMNTLYKSVTGRSFLRQDSQSTGRKLHWIVDSIKDNQQRVDVKEDMTETVKGRSSYFIEAKKIDNDHTSDYWSMPEEMGARAFESYIFDKIKEKGGRSDYLVHGVENRFYSALDMYPYPEGQEREAINQAFDNLFDTIQSRETERGVAMESRTAMPADTEFKATERAYGGREAYDRAKANGKTKLNYRQWVQVRTPNFKRWFGNWEALKAQAALDAMQPVEVRVPDDWRSLDHAELRKKMEAALDEMVRERATFNHPDLGTIMVGRVGAKKSASNARDPAKAFVVADIGSVIPSSVYARSEPPRPGDGPDIDGYSTLLAKANVGGTPLIAVFTVRHQSDGKWYYNTVTLHDAQEKAQDSYGRPDQQSAGSRFAPITGLNSFIRQPLHRVNADTVSKVTDPQTGEPMVVYHATNGDFNAFSESKRSDGFGYYFGLTEANAKKAATGKGRIIAAFIKADKIAGSVKEPAADWLQMRFDGIGRRLAGNGFDAAYIKDEARGALVVRNPTQIKSATGNNGDFDPANPDIRESRAEQKPLNAHQKFVKNIVEKAADKFKAEYSGAAALDIRVVYSRDEIPARYRPSPYAEGVYHDREGIIYLVASNMPTKQRAWQVLMHEAVGHYGLANMMGEEFSDLWPTVLQRASLGRPLNYDPMPGEKHYETVEAVRRLYPEASDSEIAQEVLARMAETMPKINWFRFAMLRIQRWISGVAERFGVKLSMSMDDVRGLVQLAGEHLRRGENLDREQAGDQVAFASQRASSESRAAPFMNVLDAGDSAIAALDGWLDRNTRVPGEWTAQQKAAAGKFATFSPRQPVKSMVRGINNRMKDRAAQLIFDQFRPLKNLSEEAFMQAHLSKATDGALEAVATLGIPVLRDGALAVDKQDDGGFIGALVKKLGNAQEVNQFLMWVAANRAEKLTAEGRENLFTPEDIAAMKGFSKGKMDDGRPRPVAYAEAHSRLKAYNKAVLDIAEQAGLIDGEARKNWESDFYIPFYRVSEETGEMDFSAGGTGLVRQKVIKQLKGGTDNLGDPLANIMANWHMMLTASMRNMAANKALEQGQSMGIADRVEMPSQAVPAAKGGTWTMQNGQKVLWQVHDPMVAESLEALNFTGYNNPAMRAAGKFKHMLTMGVTISPTFRIRNLMRDALQAVATADVGYNPLKNAVDGWKLTAKDSGTMAQLIAGGGAVRFGSFNDGQQAEYAKRMIAMGIKDNQILNTTDKLKNFFRRFYDSYQESGDRAETINRAVIYERVLNETGSHLQASFAARDLMNFTSMGSSAAIRALAQVLPFFNARLQGMDRLVRGAAADPRRFWSVAGVIGMASALLYLLQGDDDEYKALPDYVRDAYWPVKLGGMWAYIPKPFEVGALGTVVERFTELMMAGDDYQARDFRDTMVGVLANTLAMNPVPQIVKPIGEAWFNYDMFRGQAIDSMAMERLLPQERFNANTSAAAVGVGRALEVSPQKVEHLVRGYFGWLGTQALNVGDLMARPFMDMPASPKRDMSSVNNWLVAGDLFKDAGTAPSKYVERYYRVQREINAIYATASQARNLGNIDQYNELMNRPEMAARPLIKNADRQITQINQRMRAVMASQDLSVEQKNEMLTELRLRREGVARQVDEAARARAQ